MFWSRKSIVQCVGLAVLLPLYGCDRAPSVSIVGSFFPVWILCIAAGILLTVVVRALLLRTRLDQELKPAIVVYPCLAAACAFTLWLVFFS
jgi:hypothetical protein